MSGNEHDAGGVMASVRRIGASLLGLGQTRAELFAVELQEEKLRALLLLSWLSLGVALGMAAVLIVSHFRTARTVE